MLKNIAIVTTAKDARRNTSISWSVRVLDLDLKFFDMLQDLVDPRRDIRVVVRFPQPHQGCSDLIDHGIPAGFR